MRVASLILSLACGSAATAAAQGLPPLPLTSPGNPITVSKANLGKALFWDEQLGSDNVQ